MLKAIFQSVRTRGRKGFTLIELLVVIAIIGILASVVLASLNTARRKSRDARRIADVKQIQLALELCYDAGTTCSGGSLNEYPDATTSIAPNFIQSVPVDPNGGAYPYNNLTTASAACTVATGVCTSYVLGATLEDANNQALTGDVDGTLDGTSCVDPIYCVQP